MPAALCLGALALTILWGRFYQRRPRQLSMLALGILSAVLLLIATTFAVSPDRAAAWEEAAQLSLAILLFGLTTTLLADSPRKRGTQLLILISAFAFAVGVALRLGFISSGPSSLFVQTSEGWCFALVGGDPDSTATFALLFVWPLVWIAAEQEQRMIVRGAALGLTFGLCSLAVLTQSSAAWLCLGATALLGLLLFPVRLRVILWLLVPAVLMVWAFPGLNDYAIRGPAALGSRPALFILIVGTVISAFAGATLAVLERWIRASVVMRVAFAGTLVAAVLAGLVFGWTVIQRNNQDVLGLVQTRILQTIGLLGYEESEERDSHPVGALAETWNLAVELASQAPWVGKGIGALEQKYYKHRSTPAPYPSGSSSWFFRTLAAHGIPVTALVCFFLALTLWAGVWPRAAIAWRTWRTRWLFAHWPVRKASRWPGSRYDSGWPLCLTLAGLFWILSGMIRGVWANPASYLLGIFVLAVGVSHTDSWAGTLWPGLVRLLARPSKSSGNDPTQAQDRPVEHSYGFPIRRRAERHKAQTIVRTRRLQNARSRKPNDPSGPMSSFFQAWLCGIAGLVILLCAVLLAVSSLEWAAMRAAPSSPQRALSLATMATRVMPSAQSPVLLLAEILTEASESNLQGDAPSRYAAAADNLTLASVVLEKAAKRWDDSWYLWYRAGLCTSSLFALIEQHAAQIAPYDVGEAEGSLVRSPNERVRCRETRTLSPKTIKDRSRAYLLRALWLNPREPALAQVLGN